MAIKTRHYRLTAFSSNNYNSSEDQSRFVTIDNQLHFISSQVDDGTISGWDIKNVGNNTVVVSEGIGVIDNLVTSTYGNYSFNLKNNSRNFFFAKRKPDIFSERSAFSNIVSVNYTDSTAPSVPSNLFTSVVDYNFIKIKWDRNLEPDIAYYEIWRSSDSINYVKISETEENEYTDLNLTHNTNYYYKLKSYDINGLNNGSFSNVLLASTTFDNRKPADVSNVEVVNGDETIQVVWDKSVYLSHGYNIYIQNVDTEGFKYGPVSNYYINSASNYIFINNLTNGQSYYITIKSVSATGIESDGISVIGTPASNNGIQQIGGFSWTEQLIDQSYNVAINLTWDLQYESYLLDPAYYVVTIIKDGIKSESSIYLTNSIILNQYVVNGESVSIKENTSYSILVQTASSEGVLSKSYILRLKTRKYSKPGTINNLNIDYIYNQNKKDITITWDNPITDFEYNSITIKKLSLNSSSSSSFVYIENSLNYGKGQKYKVKKNLIDNNSIYTVSIKSYDSYGNSSQDVSSSVVINFTLPNPFVPGVGILNGSKPGVPEAMTSISGNDQVTLFWTPYISDELEFYNIWRANYNYGSYTEDDFIKIAQLNKDITKYIDYDVDNGLQYAYFVTVTDVNGNESLNPIDDDYYGYIFEIAEPRESSNLEPVKNINISKDLNNITLTWSQQNDSFDGYEIYQSIGDKSNFKKIDAISSENTSYTHSNALYKNGNYYYMIRKFKDEAEIFHTTNSSTPLGCVELGSVTIINNQIQIDDLKFNLKNLLDPIKIEVKKQFSKPVHEYYSIGDDRRIRLSPNLTVSDWQTVDYQVYSTQVDIRGTDKYIAYINDEQSVYSSYIDTVSGKIFFEQPIVNSALVTETNPAPSIKVVFIDTQEITGILPLDNIGDIIGNKVTKGKIKKDLLSNIDHSGRIKENCEPFKYGVTRINENSFSTTTPTGVAFYDILKINNRIMVASSNGILLSSIANASDLNVSLIPKLPASKLYKSNYYNWFFAICGDATYYTQNLSDWYNIPGLNGVKIVRDIVEDLKGNIFLSTNSGVYRLNPNEFVKLQWQQTELVNPLNNNCFALLAIGNEIYVSLEDGIYLTKDLGFNWIKKNSINSYFNSILVIGDQIFSCSNNKIWKSKLNLSKFEVVSNFDFDIRKICFFNNKLYITTDKGLMWSTNNINSQNIEFRPAHVSLNRNSKPISVYNIKNIDSKLYLTADEKIYSISSKNKITTNVDIPGVNPIIYINSKIKNVGVYYGNNIIFFDQNVDSSNVVEITRDYTKYNISNGGWADSKFDATLSLYINDIIQSPSIKPSSNAVLVANSIKQIATPFFNARTSNFEEAMKYLTRIVQLVDKVDTQGLLDPNSNINYETIAELYQNVHLFKVNINPELRSSVTLPSITASSNSSSGITYSVDVVNGILNIDTGLKKYDKVELSISGVGVVGIGEYTHKEIEDKFELYNSGLDLNFASIQQSNIIKMGIQSEVSDPLGFADKGLQYQSRYYAACDPWYDKKKSTIDYNLQVANDDDAFEIYYPTDVLHDSKNNTIWVSGKGGILGINTNTLKVFKIINNGYYFFNMHQNGEYVYAASDDGLYKININNYNYVKLVDIDIPQKTSGVLSFGDTLYVSTNEGFYYRRLYDTSWKLIFNIKNSFVKSSQKISFCVGLNPDLEGNIFQVYYSTGGINWNRSTQFNDAIINGVTQRFDSIYYATNNGVIVEDLSGLFSGQNVDINYIDLDGDDKSDEININCIDSDDSIVVACSSKGKWYKLNGNSVSSQGDSSFKTIHKVKIVNGKYWIFSANLIQIEDNDKIIKLTTGMPLI